MYCNRAPEPPYTITQEPAIGYPEYLVAEFHLPNVVSNMCYVIILSANDCCKQCKFLSINVHT